MIGGQQAPGVKDTGDDAGYMSASQVNALHVKADTDRDKNAAHHTLGPKSDQAASGKHSHDGKDSALLLQGVTLTGAKAGNAALASVITALVRLGATDSTT
jgi:hypothetical protein